MTGKLGGIDRPTLTAEGSLKPTLCVVDKQGQGRCRDSALDRLHPLGTQRRSAQRAQPA